MSPRKVTPWQDRLWSRVGELNENGCRLWTGTVSADGYAHFAGPFGIERSTTSGAHRWVYIAVHGSIPRGMQIDHLCNVRHCVNPDHLEPVTARENMLRAHARRRALKGSAA